MNRISGVCLPLFSAFIFCMATISMAQTYPEYTSTTVNDFANLLGSPLQARLSERLERLNAETGVEMAIVTLESRQTYAPSRSLEQFSTGLFNAWGIGNASRNDGVLVLILSEDREIRIELGEAYTQDWDAVAQNVINDAFIPSLLEDDYRTGIDIGSAAVIDSIVTPFLQGAAPSVVPASSFMNKVVMGVAMAVVLLVALVDPISSLLARMRRCPNCGQRSLTQTTRVLRPATDGLSGEGERTITCSNCGHADITNYSISRLRSSTRGGGFGGGRSGGGGASGRF